MGVDTQATDFTAGRYRRHVGATCSATACCSRAISRLIAGVRSSPHFPRSCGPDTVASFNERERLFALPRSSWADYDPAAISAGGGVFPRTAKTITISTQVQAQLGLTVAALAPNELIRAILLADVHLLYNGGVGHVREGRHARRTLRSATAPMTPCVSTARNCAAKCWLRVAIWA